MRNRFVMNDSLEERRRLADIESEEAKKWLVNEMDKVSEQLNREGAVRGLDTNREAYAYIYETFRRRIKEIGEKYNLPDKSRRVET